MRVHVSSPKDNRSPQLVAFALGALHMGLERVKVVSIFNLCVHPKFRGACNMHSGNLIRSLLLIVVASKDRQSRPSFSVVAMFAGLTSHVPCQAVAWRREYYASLCAKHFANHASSSLAKSRWMNRAPLDCCPCTDTLAPSGPQVWGMAAPQQRNSGCASTSETGHRKSLMVLQGVELAGASWRCAHLSEWSCSCCWAYSPCSYGPCPETTP